MHKVEGGYISLATCSISAAVIAVIFPSLDGDFYYGYSVAVIPFVLCVCVRENTLLVSPSLSFSFIGH